jgi:lysylphosphatidylglycerol synthetase-like protein (DUF2156 family)
MDLNASINPTLERHRLVELVRKWGETNTDGILDKTTQIFSVPHIDGIIGYRTELKNAVVYGDPVCTPAHKLALAQEFENYCRSKRMQAIYVIVSEEFANMAVEHLSFSLIEYGKKFILDPLKHAESKTALLRKKIRQSARNGIEVREYTDQDPHLEQSIEQVANAWVQSRKGIQIYLAGLSLFADRPGKRWFYAQQEGRVIGVGILNALHNHQGWLLNNVMVERDAPSGVSEHLVVAMLEALEKEQCRFVLIGPVPAKELGRVVGLGRILTPLAARSYKILRKLFHLDGHEIFWEKFQPELKPSCLLFPKRRFGPSSVIALLRAFNISLRK